MAIDDCRDAGLGINDVAAGEADEAIREVAAPFSCTVFSPSRVRSGIGMSLRDVASNGKPKT